MPGMEWYGYGMVKLGHMAPTAIYLLISTGGVHVHVHTTKFTFKR